MFIIIFITILSVASIVIGITATISVSKLHCDNYQYCANETRISCSKEDYDYCSTIKR